MPCEVTEDLLSERARVKVMGEAEHRAHGKTTECGTIVSLILVGVIAAGVIGFAMAYYLFLQLRENSEQDRIARSAAVIALKAYVRAGAQATPLPQRRQITYSLDAAARAVISDSLAADPISRLSTPSQTRAEFETATGTMPSSPVTVTLADNRKDSAGVPLWEASVTLGTASGANDSYTLGPFSGNSSADSVIGARVFISGLSRSSRIPLLAGYFGYSTLLRSQSQVLIVLDSTLVQSNANEALKIISER